MDYCKSMRQETEQQKKSYVAPKREQAQEGEIILISHETDNLNNLEREVVTRLILGKVVSTLNQTEYTLQPYLCITKIGQKPVTSTLISEYPTHLVCQRHNIVAYGNRDYIKDVLKVHFHARYMDVSHFISTLNEFF